MKNIEFDVNKNNGLTKKELEKLLTVWQDRLRMSDWNISISIVNFSRKDYKQSGDFEADILAKKAKILLTAKPFRGDEEYTLVHELIHILLYDYDKLSEEVLLDRFDVDSKQHDKYMEKLEETVHHLTEILLSRGCNH